MLAYLALVLVFIIPAVIAFPIALFSYKRLLKSGASRPRLKRNVVFAAGYLVAFLAEAFLILNSLSFER